MDVTVDRDPDREHVGHLTIGFDELNLLSPDRIERIHAAVADVPDEVVVLTIGPGEKALSAGLDLEWAVDRSTAEGWAMLTGLYEMIQAVRDLEAVTVCGCGQAALGAGFELALACDFRVAAADAALGLPEVRVGLPTVIQGGLLVRHLGLARAKRLIYLGETINGTEAADLGLVESAPGADRHDAAVGDLVEELAAKSPTALRWQSQAFRHWRSTGLEAGMERSIGDGAMCFGTPAQREAMRAFLDGREPAFGGGSEPK